MKDDKKSIIKEALSDYGDIMEAAEANAKQKLADEFPEKFNNLLKEAINKNKRTAKESYKKVDEIEESEQSDENESNNEESVMKNQDKETKKVEETAGKDGVFTVPAKKVSKVEETAGKDGVFTVPPKKVANVEEAAGKDGVFTVPAKKVSKVEEDVHITDTVGKGDPFKDKAKKVQKVEEGIGSAKPFGEKPKRTLQTEEFDITELDMPSVGNAIDGANGEDEVLTMEQIEEEIASMQGLGEEQAPNTENGNDKGVAYNELISMRNKLDEVIKNLGVTEMHQGNFPIDKMHQGEYDSRLVDEEESITDDDINSVIGGGEQPVAEAMGISYSAGTITPGKLGDHEGTHGRFRQDESQKKIGSLINENKNLTKKLNEVKKYKTSVGTLLEQYKISLEKYRTQLKEMAIFNTNLAHVNNILVNESLALTQDDKVKIINEFKNVNSIVESQKKYKTILSEMKSSKKTISENVVAKATVSIQPSSKQKLDEVIEKTAYADDQHFNKMKKLIEYIERNDKKIIK